MATEQDKLRQLKNPEAIKNELVKQFTKHIEEADPTDPSIVKVKMVVLGPSMSGKSSWVTRLIHDKFSSTYEATVGAQFSSQGVAIDDLEYHFEIWDVSGEKWCRSLCPMYLQHANAAIVCYDPTSRESYNESKEWVQYVKEQGDGDLVVCFVGTFADKGIDAGADVEVKAQEAQQFFTEMEGMDGQFFFPEVSSQTGDNVQDVILTIAESFHERGLKTHRGSLKNPDTVFEATMDNANKGRDFTKKREPKEPKEDAKVERCKSGLERFTLWMKKKSKVAVDETKKFSKKTIDVTRVKSSNFANTINRHSRQFGARLKKRTATLVNRKPDDKVQTNKGSMTELAVKEEPQHNTL